MGWGVTWGSTWGGGTVPLSSLASGGFGGFFAALTRGEAGRIRPDGWTPPEGDFVAVMGSDEPGRRAWLKGGDSVQMEQEADFDATKLLRVRMAWRGDVQAPAVVRVTSATTGDYTITINGTDHTYSADTAGLLLASGSTASIVAAPAKFLDQGMLAVDDLSGITEALVATGGNRLTISGAAIPANNGTHPVGIARQGFVDATEVVWNNQAGTAGDANNGALSWEIRRIPDDVTRIACGLAKLINDGSEPMFARVLSDNSITIEREDPDDPLIVTIAGNLSTHSVTWRGEMLIDGVAHWSDVIDADRSRDMSDVGALIVPLAAGLHTLAFKLTVVSSAPGMFEVELPALYVDALTFVEAL